MLRPYGDDVADHFRRLESNMIDKTLCNQHRPEMTRDDIWNRRSIRLQDFDYTQAGAYFITICTQNKFCQFGLIEDAQMIVNALGLCAQRCWHLLPEHFPTLTLDEFIVMPNHIHGIILLNDIALTAVETVELYPVRARVITGSLGAIVRSYKSAVTRAIRQLDHCKTISLWQRNYYEHVIRDESDLYIKRQYIRNNPLEWELDEFFVQ